MGKVGQSLKWSASLAGLLGLAAMTACSQPQQTSNDVAALEQTQSQGIIGGAPVGSSDPIAASTVGIVSLKTGGVICTGSLITSNMVMTAAHCTSADVQPLAILFSTHLPQNQAEADADVKNKLILPVVRGAVNSLWGKHSDNQKTNWGDIAVLKFSGVLPANYRPAKLLANPASLKNGMTITLAGFGLIDGARKTDTTDLRRVDLPLTEANFSETEVLFDQSQGRGGCHGDSGGPAFANINGQLLLFGVTSRGVDKNDTCMGLSVYTNASTYVSWLKSVVAKLNQADQKPQ